MVKYLTYFNARINLYGADDRDLQGPEALEADIAKASGDMYKHPQPAD